jgi:hypothetical protein
MRSVIQANNCHGYAVNETQKPEAIVERLAQGDLLSANALAQADAACGVSPGAEC